MPVPLWRSESFLPQVDDKTVYPNGNILLEGASGGLAGVFFTIIHGIPRKNTRPSSLFMCVLCTTITPVVLPAPKIGLRFELCRFPRPKRVDSRRVQGT